MHPALLDPSLARAPAPETFAVELTTTRGPIVIDVERALAPLGADRFFNLVGVGYYQDVAFFRVIAGFMAQAGIHGDPTVNKVWKKALFPDDPRRLSNTTGTVSFATSGKNARTTQFFINTADNQRLDAVGFSPFGRIRDVAPVQALHAGYGESVPNGAGPLQGRLQREGNVYLRAEFPLLDYIEYARIIDPA